MGFQKALGSEQRTAGRQNASQVASRAPKNQFKRPQRYAPAAGRSTDASTLRERCSSASRSKSHCRTLGASFGVGLHCGSVRRILPATGIARRRDESIAALRPPRPRKPHAFDYDALYAAPPRREGPVYAFLRDGWNGALDGARKPSAVVAPESANPLCP